MREVLLDTAVDHFGRFGFEGAATRAIAKASSTAMSSITYHFGGKQGLYVAAAEHIAEQIRELHGPALEAARAAQAETREQATDTMLALLDAMAAMMLGERSAKWARFIIREQQEPTEAFDRIYQLAMRPFVETFVHLIAIARPDLGERERRASGFLLFGQALAMRAGRASLCRLMGLERMDAATETLMRARLRANALCILSAGPETSE